jgi:hypothetical protein
MSSKIIADEIMKNNDINDTTTLLNSIPTPCSYEKKDIDNSVFSSLLLSPQLTI